MIWDFSLQILIVNRLWDGGNDAGHKKKVALGVKLRKYSPDSDWGCFTQASETYRFLTPFF